MHRWHDPQPSATGAAATGNGAVVMTEPSTKKLPEPGNKMLAFLPNQPRPASHAASRSTTELSSANATALKPSARSRSTMALSAMRSGS